MTTQENVGTSVLDVLDVKARFILKENINLEDRVLQLNTAITSKSIDKFIRALSFLESMSDSVITIFINSPGGDVYSAFNLIDRIQNSSCDIITVGTGLVASAAIPILVSGDIRMATRNVSLMYHEPSFNSPFQRLTAAEIETKHVKQLGQKLNRFMAESTKKPYSYWAAISKHVDFYFDAEKAVELGVIDSIEKRV